MKLPAQVSRAAAVLLAGAASGPLFAQSTVNISGTIDIGVYRDFDKTTKVGSISRSNIAFAGSEDLGGGLAATFRLNHRFAPDTGVPEGSPNKPFWHGESTVGLKGAFGAIRFGRALDAMYNNDWNYDPWYYFDSIASPAWDLWHWNFPSDPKANNGTPDYGRLNNGIFYDSPSMGGFQLHLSGSPEKRPGDRNRPLGASVTYGNGPFSAMLAHEKNSDGGTDTFVGLKGGLGPVTLMGAFDTSKATPNGIKAKTFTMGAQYVVGLWTLDAGWGQVKVGNTKPEKVLGLGGLYNLSKRTYLYADVARKTLPTMSQNGYGAGINHSF